MQASLLVPDLHGPWHPLLKAQNNPKDPYDSKGYTHTHPEGRRIEGADKVVVRPGTSSSVKVAS